MYRMDWTDGRLQERFDSIDRRFDEVDRRFGQVDRQFEQVDRQFEQVDQRFDRVDESLRELRAAIGQMNQRFDGLEHTLVHGVLALTGAIVAGFAAMIVLIATQL